MSSTYFEFAFSSADPDETEQHLANLYGNIQIKRQFEALTNHAAGDERFQIADGRFDGSCVSTVDLNQFFFTTATSARPWQEGRASGDNLNEPAVFRPKYPYTAWNADTEVRFVSIDPAALQRTARLLYGRDDLVLSFDGPRPSTPAAASTWLAVSTMARAHRQGGTLRNDLTRASVYRLLAVTALESFRLAGDRNALHISAERRKNVHRVAADFIHTFASLPITIDDVADAAGASVPELVLAFRSHTIAELTPTSYLRGVRLDAARQDLRDGDPTAGDTVAQISQKWGFSSPSRFAALFRALYGVSPKWVLDR